MSYWAMSGELSVEVARLFSVKHNCK
jgi:hypothetical protein